MPAEKAILFVNKTANSKFLSRSEHRERARIFSHVQRCSPSTTPSPQPKEALGSGEAQGWRRKTRKSQCRDSTGVAGELKKLWGLGELTPAQALALLSGVPSPPNELEPPLPAPAPAAWMPYVHHLMDFYAGPSATKVFPVKSLVDDSRSYTISLALQDPLLLSSLLCTVSAAVYARTGLAEHGYNALCFKVQTIRGTQSALARTGKLGISGLYAISLLLWVECVGGEAGDIRAHLSGLEYLVTDLPSLVDCPVTVLRAICGFSLLCAAMLQIRPGPWPELARMANSPLEGDEVVLSHSLSVPGALGAGFFRPPIAKALGERLLSLMELQAECLVLEGYDADSGMELPIASARKIAAQRLAVDHQLLSLPFEEDQPPLTAIQDSVRLALFMSTQPIVSMMTPSCAFAKTMAQQLKAALECSPMETAWGDVGDLLLWVLCVGCVLSKGEELGGWFVEHLLNTVRWLGLTTIGEIKETLSSFDMQGNFDSALGNVWGL